MKLTFYGAAKEVTGVNYLLETKNYRILIDCGLIQSRQFIDARNFKPFPYDPAKIDFLFLSHAHTDHVGRVPKLYQDGFRGKIICTWPTRDLAELNLVDGIKVIRRFKKGGLYKMADLRNVLKLFQPVDYDQIVTISDKFQFRLREAGHILGSSITELWLDGKKITVTGDLGNSPPPLIRGTAAIDQTDYLIIESAYGDRIHPDAKQRKLLLERTIEDAVTRKGVLLIPIVALEKAQELLYELNELVERNRVPRLPVFIDSPLAIKFTSIYSRYPQFFNEEAAKLIQSGDDLFNFPGLSLSITKDQSRAIRVVPSPKIILAGSGTSLGGRILNHEFKYLSDSKNTILLIGFQVPRSPGRQLIEGAKSLKIFGKTIPVRAKIVTISGYSAHADQTQLRNFVANLIKPVKKIFVAQGEEKASKKLAQIIQDELGLPAVVPNLGESFNL